MLEDLRYEDWERESIDTDRFGYHGDGFSTKENQGRYLTWYSDDLEAFLIEIDCMYNT